MAVTVSEMSFPRAIACLIEGAQITKLEWTDNDQYCQLKDGYLMIHRDGKWHKWIINDGDLLGEDWIIRKYDTGPRYNVIGA